MFTVIYRWRVKPGSEDRFVAAWHALTKQIHRVRQSYGSRLHRESDGTYCAIALWPSEEAWKIDDPPLHAGSTIAAFQECIEQRLPTVTMESIDDLWRMPTLG